MIAGNRCQSKPRCSSVATSACDLGLRSDHHDLQEYSGDSRATRLPSSQGSAMQPSPVRLRTTTHRPSDSSAALRGVLILPWRGQAWVVKAEPVAAVSATAADSGSESDGDTVPEGCARYTVELSRPLGLVLEEKSNGEIVVGEVPVGGQAARQGMVQAGDLLISVTGVAYTRESNYQGATVRSGETRVTLNVRNEAGAGESSWIQ